ncbi:MAG: hypothetical protein ABI851_12560 [Saprospiraceae bacterium]
MTLSTFWNTEKIWQGKRTGYQELRVSGKLLYVSDIRNSKYFGDELIIHQITQNSSINHS